MDKYLKVIKENIPELVIGKCSMNSEGQNNDIIIVNEETIFKFPKYNEGVEKLKREIKILGILKKYISIDIPCIKYVNLDPCEPGYVFAGYGMIKGIPLRKNVFMGVQNRETVANQLAVFLKELHSIPINEFIECGIDLNSSANEWEVLYEKIKDKLFKYMRSECRKKIIIDFEAFFGVDHDIKKAVIHGDFGGSNIICDPGKGKISGIIDFNDVSAGDPAVDFAALTGPFGYG
jgi:aminoglycoside 2''-phosphotransferase